MHEIKSEWAEVAVVTFVKIRVVNIDDFASLGLEWFLTRRVVV